MADPKYTTSYTGQQVVDAITRALPLDTFVSSTETFNSVNYHVIWKTAPTASNTVYGIAVHPTTGRLYIVKSVNNSKSLQYLNLETSDWSHPVKSAADASAVKVGQDAHGHVVLGGSLQVSDIEGLTDALGAKQNTLVSKTNIKALNDGTTDYSLVGSGNVTFKTINNTSVIGSGNISLSDLGITGAMHFKGTVSSLPTASTSDSYNNGDVILVGNKEYVRSGKTSSAAGSWVELGDESSHALNTVKIEGTGGYITNDLVNTAHTIANDIKLAHKEYSAATPSAVKIGRDTGGHVEIGDPLELNNNGAHTHTVTVTAPANTYLTQVVATTTGLALDKKTATFVKSYPGTTKLLKTTNLWGLKTNNSGVLQTTTASKATAGTAVVYGTADVDTTVTGLAKRAANQTLVGDADYNTTATSVIGSASASLSKNPHRITYDSVEECLNFEEVTLSATFTPKEIHEAKLAETQIYACTADQVSIVPAKAADSTRKITPYSFTDVVVPVAADATTIIATGELVSSDTNGGEVLVGLGTPTTDTGLLNTTAIKTVATNSDVTVATGGLTPTKNTATTFSGSAAENGEHTHTFK